MPRALKTLSKPASNRARSPRCTLSKSAAGELVEQVIKRLKTKGFRRTEALASLLTEMARSHRPMTFAELGSLTSLAGRDQATIYRIIVKLDEAGVLRRLGFRDRAAHYQLIIPGHHHDYLVCKSCGTVAEVDVPQPLEPLEKEIAAQSGWKAVEHELEFFGVCPSCSD